MGGRAACTPLALAEMIMRAEFDAPSPLERMCARALGLAEEDLEKDTALIDFVKAAARRQQQQQGGKGEGKAGEGEEEAEFVPPPEFYTRFAAQLDEQVGSSALGAGVARGVASPVEIC